MEWSDDHLPKRVVVINLCLVGPAVAVDHILPFHRRGQRREAGLAGADPLEYLEELVARERAARGWVDGAWFAPGELCVVGAEAARYVLSNRDGAYREHSDFFATRSGVFSGRLRAAVPRTAQVEIIRAAKAFLAGYLSERSGELPELVRQHLAPAGGPPVSHWPDAANRLLDAYLRDAVLSPEAPDSLHQVLGRLIERAVLAGARQRQPRLSRLALRHQVSRELTAEIQRRRAAVAHAPTDLLDVVIAAGLEDPVREIGPVFLAFLFTFAGNLAFALAWSVYLAGTHPSPGPVRPLWIAREALRLWPVAWLIGRHPARPHAIAGTEAGMNDEVSVCTYLLHRDPRYWDRPGEFDPARWATASRNLAYLPFGYGPHACAGATISAGILESLIQIIVIDHRVTLTPLASRPQIGPLLAPPPFTLTIHDTPGLSEGR